MFKYNLIWYKNFLIHNKLTSLLILSIFVSIFYAFNNGLNYKQKFEVDAFLNRGAIVIDKDNDEVKLIKNYKRISDNLIEVDMTSDMFLLSIAYSGILSIFLIFYFSFHFDKTEIEDSTIKECIIQKSESNFKYYIFNGKIIYKASKEDDGYFPYVTLNNLVEAVKDYKLNRSLFEDFKGTFTERRNYLINEICQKDPN